MAYSGIIKDASDLIDTGGTAQQALPAQTGRKFLLIQNPVTATEALWFSFTGAAEVDEPGSLSLAAGGAMSFEGPFCPSNALSVIAATTNHEYTVNWA